MEVFIIALLFSLIISVSFGFLIFEMTESIKKVCLSILIAFVFWFSLAFYGYFVSGKKWKLVETNKIYSLDLSNLVSGTFFLGSGSISHSYIYYNTIKRGKPVYFSCWMNSFFIYTYIIQFL